ncbi:UBX domain-containing protein 4 [Rhizopus stolonifer]|uniref:UBX domain-containing protein 2 n=1 Tax=Rhizopus stolonifer TaxID=4846 RepID=A0A367JFW0_RHIST|nr:UBX domain-containing protein 4 [Rhizopus stolonifer]
MATLDNDIWFTGPVSDAIALVSQKNCTFLVYIHDDSEKTDTLNKVFQEEKVIKTIKEDTIALAMQKDSENAKMFGQYYPIQAVPILYFIRQGTIRDFGIETITSQEIIDKINATNTIQTSSVPLTETSTTSAPPPQQAPTQVSTEPSSTVSEEQAEAKKAEMQKQLEKIRKERAEREQREAKEREIKRRQESKAMQEAQQSQTDKQNKVYFDKIKKERQEDEAHRKRVREQIARDRAEKIAQRTAEKQRLQAREIASSNNSGGNINNVNNHEFSNLSIRQLDGSNIRHQFKATDTMSTVREWIQQNRTDDTGKPYKLSSQFPTRLFTESDDNTSLTNLNLCPSATMIMKPLKTSPSSSSSLVDTSLAGYVMSAYDFVYGILLMLFNMSTGILSSMFPTHGMRPLTAPSQNVQQPITRPLRGGQRLGGEGLSSGESSAMQQNETLKRSNPYKTRINTLRDDDQENDDEKRATYNGNSVNHE